jgi:benzodiazapine receptor
MCLSDLVNAFDGEVLALYLFGTYFVAGIGSALSPDLRLMYETSVRPCFAPPSWLFGVVWSVLYTLSGIAAYLVRIEGGPWTSGSGSSGNLAALILYSVLQVVLASYSIFSSRRWHWTAAAVVFAGLGLTLATAILFGFHSVVATVFIGVLGGWILFALVLQIQFARLNPQPSADESSDEEEGAESQQDWQLLVKKVSPNAWNIAVLPKDLRLAAQAAEARQPTKFKQDTQAAHHIQALPSTLSSRINFSLDD